MLLAKAAGETTLQAIAEWMRLRASRVQELVPGVQATFPCVATSRNVGRAVVLEHIHVIIMVVGMCARAAIREPAEQEHVAAFR